MVFEKLKFWRKEDEFDFDKLVEKEAAEKETAHSEPAPGEWPGYQEKSPFQEEPPAATTASPFSRPLTPTPVASSRYPGPSAAAFPNRELELINSKLDTIKALLASLDQRLANIEQQRKDKKLW
ncbi:hypothetical protein HYX14_04910 [Candidatus Woesearchaeota archaeon]|nr:hypothetical protein [Candidatus Woesearchaeota archaeon]